MSMLKKDMGIKNKTTIKVIRSDAFVNLENKNYVNMKEWKDKKNGKKSTK